MFSEIAFSDTPSNVRSEQELVNDRWCHVLERGGFDCLWIDSERHGTLVARETCSRLNGALAQRIELGDFKEAANGIWMPYSIRNIHFDFLSSSDSGRQRQVKNALLQLVSVSVNDVPDSVFTFEPSPGSLHVRDDGTFSQQTAGGVDHIDRLGLIIATYHPNTRNRLSLTFCLFLFVGLTSPLIGACELLRHLTVASRKTATESPTALK